MKILLESKKFLMLILHLFEFKIKYFFYIHKTKGLWFSGRILVSGTGDPSSILGRPFFYYKINKYKN